MTVNPAERLRARVELQNMLGLEALYLSELTLMRMLNHIGGDADLAYTALTMWPRPQWVIEIAGPLIDLEPPNAKEKP